MWRQRTTHADGSSGPRKPSASPDALGNLCRFREHPHLDLALELVDLARVDEACAEPRRRFRAAGHAEAQALLGRAALVAGGDVAGEGGVARAHGRDRLTRLDHHAEERRGAAGMYARDTAVGHGHDRLARAE